MKKTIMESTLALAIASASTVTLANGIAINEQSVSGMGTAYAGRSSAVNDTSIVYGNPAGMSELSSNTVTAGATYIKAKVDIKDVNTTAPPFRGSNKGDMVPNTTIPLGYIVTSIDDQWHFGLGVYVPYGIINDYEKGYQGRYQGEYSKVQVITVQPTLSYKFNEHVSVGFGPTINRINGKLTSNVPNAVGTTPLGSDARIAVKGSDTAYGFNAGLLVKFNDQLSWGTTYRSKVDYKLDGHTKVSNAQGNTGPVPPILPGLNGTYGAKLNVTLPESLDSSLTYKLDDRWTLYGGATWTRWSRMNKLEVRTSGLFPAYQSALGTTTEQLNWHNTWSYALGASYQLNREWVLRTGFALDPSPTDNEHRNVRIPVGNRKIVSLGAGWTPVPEMTVDVAYFYLWESDASVNRASSSTRPGYSAKYENSAQGLGTQLTYRF